jgi:DNA-binding CsgD family transcriptional regulator
VAARFPDLHPLVRSRVLGVAQGNPLALLELPQALSDSQRSAMEPLPLVLPLGQRLQELFTSRVAQLPPATRALLLAAALEGAGDLRVLEAAGGRDYQIDDLAPAERDHLVRTEENSRRITFGHPLIRSAAVEASTTGERRRAHQALATVLADQPERRAWHLGEASVEPDERVAALLEEAAHRTLQRGDYFGAMARLTRAADLSPAAAERSRRLAKGAYIGAEAIGEMKSTSELLEGARQASPYLSDPLHYASAAAFVILNGDGHVDTAHQLLVGAIEGGAHRYDSGDTALINAMWTLYLLCFCGGRRELWDPFYAALARLSPEPPPLLALQVDMFVDPARTGAAALPRLEAVLRTVHHEVDPSSIENTAGCALYADRLAELREPLWRTVLKGREGGPGRRHLVALVYLCLDDFHRGEWGEAAELAAEGLRISEERGGRFFGWYFRYLQALLAAVQGRFDTSRALAGQIIGWAGPRGVAALTPQELQIARLAASGMTNKQIAERLFLSPRTVGGHLYQIFPKLGITTRAALRDALDGTDNSLASRALRRRLQGGNPPVEGPLRSAGIRFPQRDGRRSSRREAR